MTIARRNGFRDSGKKKDVCQRLQATWYGSLNVLFHKGMTCGISEQTATMQDQSRFNCSRPSTESIDAPTKYR